MTEQKNHYPRRVRNTLQFREVTVLRSEIVASHFQRIVFGGSALAGFSSAGFDDHSKVFFPQPGVEFVAPQVTEDGIVWQSDVRPPSRDYTPLFDAARQELTLDFYLHADGVASNWARQAQAGDKLIIGGPRGSLVVPVDYRWQLYLCDETGMPALRRRLETLREYGVAADSVRALVTVSDAASGDYLAHLSEFNIDIRVAATEANIAAWLGQWTIPQSDYFIWLTGEGEMIKRIITPLEGKVDAQLLRAVAYWHQKGE
ncbi:siderophore-interacting protein [Entomohabitans teleogrylli]|uniref:siderophore-interacting protein n=1 Tax=Entomohabitans teleogrylli TaxID=1384589 RepID=UPI00073D7E0B|nr:siderophore-interacting protein [Entomohabitans teleogrylli]